MECKREGNVGEGTKDFRINPPKTDGREAANLSCRDHEAEEYMDAVHRGFFEEACVKAPQRGGVDIEEMDVAALWTSRERR